MWAPGRSLPQAGKGGAAAPCSHLAPLQHWAGWEETAVLEMRTGNSWLKAFSETKSHRSTLFHLNCAPGGSFLLLVLTEAAGNRAPGCLCISGKKHLHSTSGLLLLLASLQLICQWLCSRPAKCHFCYWLQFVTLCAEQSLILCNTAGWCEKGKAAFEVTLHASFPSCCHRTVMLLENIVRLFPSGCLSLTQTKLFNWTGDAHLLDHFLKGERRTKL